jgi:hypothetical protein
VVAILDTNCDPDEVDYPIPGNDDAIRAGSLLTRIVADAVAEGLRLRSVYASEAAGKEGTAAISVSPADEEPLAEWERELLESDSGNQAQTGRTEGAAAPATASADKPAAEAKGGSRGAARAKAETRTAGAPVTDQAAGEATQPAAGTKVEGTPAEPDGGSSTETQPAAATQAEAAAAQSEDTATQAEDTATLGEGTAAQAGEAEAAVTQAEGRAAAGAEAGDATQPEPETGDAPQAEGTPAEAAEVAADPTNETRSPRV